MKKMYVKQVDDSMVVEWMNKGHVAEFSARRHFDNTLTRYYKDSMPYQYYADIENGEQKISVKTVGCEFTRIDKDLANNEKDTFKLLADTAKKFISEDYANTYWVMVLPVKQDTDRPDDCYTVIEMNKDEMLKCILDTCVMDNGKLRLKKTHDSFMTWYNEEMGIGKKRKARA